jgi:hypothetical protein
VALNPFPGGIASKATQRAADGLDPAAEVERLRALLEKQPSCLLRVGTDGKLLAVSDVALRLLGANDLAQVLDTNFVERLQGDGAGVWADFVHRVSHSGSGSAECEMTDLTGARRAVTLLGVALPNHPDGLGSMLIAVRDVSTARRLEASLQEQEGLRRSVQAALDEATADLQRLRAQLDEVTGERRQLHATLEAVDAQRKQIATWLEQLTKGLGVAMDAASRARHALEKPPPK